MEGTQIKKLGLLAVFALLLVLVSMIFLPFTTVIIWSALFYAFLYPIFLRLTVRRNGREMRGFPRSAIAAGLAVFGVLLIAVPGVLLLVSLARQLSVMIREALVTIESNPSILGLDSNGVLSNLLRTASGGSIDLSKLNLVDEIRNLLASRADRIIGLSGQFLKLSGGALVNLVFMIFTIFFLLIDGRHLVKVVIGALPIERSYTTIFLRKFRDMGRHLVTGYVLVALLQAAVMVIMCAIFNIKGGLVIAFLTALGSFIPVIGASLVIVPVAASKLLVGDLTGAIIFLVVSAVLVWAIDSFVRPFLLEGRLKIHPLLIFFSILGGLQVFKFNGLVLGPLILTLFFTAIELYEQAYEGPTGDQRRRKEDTDQVQEGEGRA
jgi:predicted PurR-regulated permease PerM